MRELALHLLDIAQNSVSAGARDITITVEENTQEDRLRISVEDNGKGMDAELVRLVTDPFTTSRTERNVGLGIPLLKDAAEASNGDLSIVSEVGVGTTVTANFQRSHIDLMPLGDIPGTWLSLLVGCPQIHWRFIYRANDQAFELDDREIKDVLGDVPLSEPSVLNYLRNLIAEGIKDLQPVLRDEFFEQGVIHE